MSSSAPAKPRSSAHDPRRTLSVRAHLAAIVAVLGLILLGVGAYQSAHAFSTARHEAGLDTAFQAGLAADALERSVEEASAFTASTAAGPSIVQLFDEIDGRYDLCSLSGSGSGVFPDGAIHFIDRTGFLFCSSVQERVHERDIRYEGMAWFAEAREAEAGTALKADPFVDPATGGVTVAFAAPVRDPAGETLGLVVYALPVRDVATELETTYGGPDRLTFEVVQTATGTVISSSEAPPQGGGVSEVDFRIPPEGAVPGLDGIRRFYRAAPAGGTGFTVTAGVEEAATLADAWEELWGHVGLAALALVVTLMLGLLVNRRIGRPLRRLTSAAAQAARAVTPEPVAVDGPREIRQLVERFNGMLAARMSVEGQLLERAMFDELTGLPSRAVVLDRLSQALERTRRDEGSVAVLSVDLDRFGLVNDSLGRDVGDRMLVLVAHRIRSVLRPEDTIARFYGDEFVLLCEGVASREEAGAVAGRIASALRPPLRDGDLEATISVSIGIALGRYGRDSADTLIRDADAARTRAKERGKARHEFFEDSMREGAKNRLALENELRRAVERNELDLVYQPMIDLRSGRIVGAEALLRWHHPTKGVLLPGVFIDLAEETGLIVPIGRRALEQACAQAAAWRAQGYPIRLSVNLSAKQIAEPKLEETIGAILGETRLDPSLLCVEITENALMREDTTATVLEGIRRLGVAVSVDDFGTGYSSLAYLQRFSIDELKIDRSFIRDLGRSESAAPLVQAIVGVARALGLSVVAEGIEEEQQLREVKALDCDAAQGFLIMRPQPPALLAPLLELDSVPLPDDSTVGGGTRT